MFVLLRRCPLVTMWEWRYRYDQADRATASRVERTGTGRHRPANQRNVCPGAAVGLRATESLLALDDYDPDEAVADINKIMAQDDANDPLLESYQHYGRRG